jgi:hypothetical protein
MKKIDRLGWAAGLSFISYGVRVGVRVNNAEALALAQDYFPLQPDLWRYFQARPHR